MKFYPSNSKCKEDFCAEEDKIYHIFLILDIKFRYVDFFSFYFKHKCDIEKFNLEILV